MTINIIKSGRIGVVECSDNRLHMQLFKHLSYEKLNAQFIPNKMWRYVRLYSLKTHRFPYGLINLVEKIVKQYCEQFNETYVIKDDDKRIFYDMQRGSDSFLYPFQRQAMLRMINARQGIIHIPTGGGKTVTALCALNKLVYDKAIVIVPSKEIKTQWEKKIEELNVVNCKVLTYQYLARHLEMLTDLDIVIQDEVHHTSASTLYKIALRCGKANVYGLTATPKRSDGHTMKVLASIGDIIYSVGIRQLINEGYLCDAEVKVVEFPKYDIEMWDTYDDVYRNQITENIERTKEIIRIAKKESQRGLVLILVDKVEHTKTFEQLDKDIVIVTGKSNKKDRKSIYDNMINGKHKIVIATKIYGEGVDIPSLHTIILASGGKSCVKVIQNIGRVLRIFEGKEKALIIDCKDNCKYFKNHFIERAVIYNENNFQVSDYA
jgi:superfamily II DNA or RNA helicase